MSNNESTTMNFDPAAKRLADIAVSRRASWRDDAACIDMDPAMFFSKQRAVQNAALEVCARCSVRRECFADVFMTAEGREDVSEGVRGGTTGGQRSALISSTMGRRCRSARHLGWSLEDTAAFMRIPVETVAALWAESPVVRDRPASVSA